MCWNYAKSIHLRALHPPRPKPAVRGEALVAIMSHMGSASGDIRGGTTAASAAPGEITATGQVDAARLGDRVRFLRGGRPLLRVAPDRGLYITEEPELQALVDMETKSVWPIPTEQIGVAMEPEARDALVNRVRHLEHWLARFVHNTFALQAMDEDNWRHEKVQADVDDAIYFEYQRLCDYLRNHTPAEELCGINDELRATVKRMRDERDEWKRKMRKDRAGFDEAFARQEKFINAQHGLMQGMRDRIIQLNGNVEALERERAGAWSASQLPEAFRRYGPPPGVPEPQDDTPQLRVTARKHNRSPPRSASPSDRHGRRHPKKHAGDSVTATVNQHDARVRPGLSACAMGPSEQIAQSSGSVADMLSGGAHPEGHPESADRHGLPDGDSPAELASGTSVIAGGALTTQSLLEHQFAHERLADADPVSSWNDTLGGGSCRPELTDDESEQASLLSTDDGGTHVFMYLNDPCYMLSDMSPQQQRAAAEHDGQAYRRTARYGHAHQCFLQFEAREQRYSRSTR